MFVLTLTQKILKNMKNKLSACLKVYCIAELYTRKRKQERTELTLNYEIFDKKNELYTYNKLLNMKKLS